MNASKKRDGAENGPARDSRLITGPSTSPTSTASLPRPRRSGALSTAVPVSPGSRARSAFEMRREGRCGRSSCGSFPVIRPPQAGA